MALLAKSVPANGTITQPLEFSPNLAGGTVAQAAFVRGRPPATPAPNTLYVVATVHNQPATDYAAVGIAADPDATDVVLIANSSPPAAATVIDIKAWYQGTAGVLVACPDAINLTLLPDPGAAVSLTVTMGELR